MDNSSSDFNIAIEVAIRGVLVAVTFPLLIVYIFCLVALCHAKEIKLKMRVLVAYNLVPEVLITIMPVFMFAENLLRVYTEGNAIAGVFCAVIFVIFNLNIYATVLSTPFFAFSVYIMLKFDSKKLKWWVIVSYIIVSWGATVLFTIPSPILTVLYLMDGPRCDVDVNALPFTIYLALRALLPWISVGVVIVFSILTYCHVRGGTISGNSDGPSNVRQAMTKLLIFECGKGIFQLFLSIVFVVIGIYVTVTARDFVRILATTVLDVSLGFVPLVNLVIYVAFLKPVRTAIKLSCASCPCIAPIEQQPPSTNTGHGQRSNQVHPLGDTQIVVTDL